MALLGALLAPWASPRASAQEASGPAGGVYLELLDGAPLALLEDADAALRERDLPRAAQGYQALLDLAAGPLKDRLVVLRAARTGGESLTAPAPSHDEPAAYVSLPAALRARLSAMPPDALRAYRAEVDARAIVRAGAAIERRDLALLAEVRARWLFSTRGAEAAILAGDLALEAGDLVAAVSSYEAAQAVPDAPASLARRVRGAQERLRREDACAEAVPEASDVWPAGAGGASLAVALGEAESGLSAALTCPPVHVPGGVAVVAPGRAIVVRDLAPDAPAGPRARVLPPGAGPLASSRPGPFSLGGAAARGLFAAAIEGPRGLLGADLLAGSAASVFDDAHDLFVFDAARGDRLVMTTAEAKRFDAETAAWLPGVEWTARPVLAPGLVLGVAIGRTGEPEVSAAAFETGPGRPRLRWRTFLCARGLRGAVEGESDGPPLEPALARGGGRLFVETGVGLTACLDAQTGEVLWAVRAEPPAVDSPEWRTVLRGHHSPEENLVLRPTDAPLFVPPAREGERGLVVVSARPSGGPAVVALDAATGEVVYRLSADGWAFPVAALPGGRLAVVEDGALALVDARSGKRISSPLPLPRDPDGSWRRCDSIGRGVACEGGRLVVPVRDGALVMAIEETERGPVLRPVRALSTAPGSCVAAGALPGGFALADAAGLTLVALERPGGVTGAAAWEDALGVAEAYDGVFPPDLPALLAAPARTSATAALEGSGERPGGEIDVVVDETLGLVRARLPTIPASDLTVSVILERATGRPRVEVEASPEGRGLARARPQGGHDDE